MNIKQLQKDAIESRIQDIKRLNHMMEENYGMYANQPGWDALDHEYIKDISDNTYRVREGLKPFLRDMYIATNKEIISSLEYQLWKLHDEQSGS